ncbi:hypothetical protein B0T13DRAFT_445230 [Neurospora crassa]|nr:hypothetical protein B0T13DRAFT_445230 [Neurospora crassa]
MFESVILAEWWPYRLHENACAAQFALPVSLASLGRPSSPFSRAEMQASMPSWNDYLLSMSQKWKLVAASFTSTPYTPLGAIDGGNPHFGRVRYLYKDYQAVFTDKPGAEVPVGETVRGIIGGQQASFEREKNSSARTVYPWVFAMFPSTFILARFEAPNREVSHAHSFLRILADGNDAVCSSTRFHRFEFFFYIESCSRSSITRYPHSQLETADQSRTLRTSHESLFAAKSVAVLQTLRRPSSPFPTLELNKPAFDSTPATSSPSSTSNLCLYNLSLVHNPQRTAKHKGYFRGYPKRRKCFSLSRAQPPLLLKQPRQHGGLVIRFIDIVPVSKRTRAGQRRLVHMYFEQYDGLLG